MKISLAVFLVVVGFVGADICTDSTGHWLMSLAEGVTDFAYGGSRLNQKYYCFEGCLNTATALQNYKVDLAGTNATFTERTLEVKKVKARLETAVRDGDDPNVDFCVDPVLRKDVTDALAKTANPNCKGIVNTLVLNLNRPGWAITCIQFDEFAMDSVASDKNFCNYEANFSTGVFIIRLAKLDMS